MTLDTTVKKRDLKLKEHNIGESRYRELLYFCRQYDEKVKELAKMTYMSGMSYDDEQRGGGAGNPTEQKAMRKAQLEKDIELITQTAIEAEPDCYQYLLENITEAVPYEHLSVPMGRRQFYQSRRYFFYLLSIKK